MARQKRGSGKIGIIIEKVVPDASVLLKWVLPPVHEHHVEQAIAIRNALLVGKVRLLVPHLWYYELGNTLSRKYPDNANALLSSLMDMECPQHDQDWQTTTIQLVSSFHVTFYDAAYHALAINQNGFFVTADEKYIQKACQSLALGTSKTDHIGHNKLTLFVTPDPLPLSPQHLLWHRHCL